MPGILSAAVETSNLSDTHSIGCSLWLLPPIDSPIQSMLSDLIIRKIPSRFPNVQNVVFEPHLTLTSEIKLPPDIATNKQAQRWLDDVPLPGKINLDVRFESLDVGAQYFKKLTLSVDKAPLENFGAHIRSTVVEKGDMAAATSWAKDWTPHVSLLYASIEVTDEKCQEILQVIREVGLRIGKEPRLVENGTCDLSAWNGGRIALVETWKELRDWKIVASRAM